MVDRVTKLQNGAERGDATRAKLLAASIEVFGRYGFDVTTTRALADAAGVNLQAINYYFRSKEGLYLAAAEHIAASIAGHIGTVRMRLRSRLEAHDAGEQAIAREEAQALLSDILQALAAIFTSPESEVWARFLIREQMEPTDAFERVYQGAMRPVLEVAGRLVGLLLEEDPMSEHVRMRTMSLVGGLMIFRVARAAAEAHLGWTTVGEREVAQVRALADELARGLARQKGER